MDRILIFILSIAFFALGETKLIQAKNNKYLDDVALITKSGYENEVHEVETEDGYILKVHRIKSDSNPTRSPVFLMHGLFCTAADFLMTGPKIALPYLLADRGYDVWLGNSRGNDHSLKHKTLKTKSKDFWNFSWHEIGYHDLAAMINYMLKVSKKSRTFYVGHSQGTTSLMVLLSQRPEFNQKIIHAHLMAPPIFMKNFPHPMMRLFVSELESFINEHENYEILTSQEFANFFKYASIADQAFCKRNSSTSNVCEATLALFFGKNENGLEIDTRILPDYLKHIAHTGSIKQVNHFFQLHSSGKFRQYDYQHNNFKFYNASSPPDYDLTAVESPIYIYTGGCDILVAESDVLQLKERLPNVRKYRNIRNYNHADFNYGKNSRTLLFESILNSMENESGRPKK